MKTPLEPFVRATYRWNRAFGNDWLWRVEPRVFLQSQRGAGISVQNVLDHVFNDTWLVRSYSVIVAEEEVEGSTRCRMQCMEPVKPTTKCLCGIMVSSCATVGKFRANGCLSSC